MLPGQNKKHICSFYVWIINNRLQLSLFLFSCHLQMSTENCQTEFLRKRLNEEKNKTTLSEKIESTLSTQWKLRTTKIGTEKDKYIHGRDVFKLILGASLYFVDKFSEKLKVRIISHASPTQYLTFVFPAISKAGMRGKYFDSKRKSSTIAFPWIVKRLKSKLIRSSPYSKVEIKPLGWKALFF